MVTCQHCKEETKQYRTFTMLDHRYFFCAKSDEKDCLSDFFEADQRRTYESLITAKNNARKASGL